MTAKKGPIYTYKLAGTVTNLTGAILPSDTKSYLVFGFFAELEKRAHNGVFYIRLENEKASEIAAIVVTSLVKETQITITFTMDIPWDQCLDPSAIVSDATES
jgi:hypothetical protein